MAQIQDYKGDFNPEFKFTDFTPEFMSELLRLYGKLYIGIDGFWYLGVKEHINNEMALKVDLWAWDKATRYELKRLTALAGIAGNGIDALFKLLQIVPWMQVTDYKLEMDGDTRGTLTVSRCSILEALEREGQGREKEICHIVDAAILQKYADFFNPDIKVTPLFLPPREDKSGLCCKWEFTLE